ncbi:GtrA family protein [Neorhodopirellula pilleata]|uniref:GtrA family protein n=1 Tax=Neorhodopirellula pilleata TaxID=2714738 RepID=UPI0018CCF43B|nr:GtrA family protein [Neorhodopirellula pilleata]
MTTNASVRIDGSGVNLLHRQWVRYLIAGAFTALVDLFGFHLLETFVLPCDGISISEIVRSRHFAIDKTVAFVTANTVSYWVNSRWVFEQGRHRPTTEAFLFFGVSLLSYFGGLQFGRLLITVFNTPSLLAAVTCIAFSTVLNYTIRKMFVFR